MTRRLVVRAGFIATLLLNDQGRDIIHDIVATGGDYGNLHKRLLYYAHFVRSRWTSGLVTQDVFHPDVTQRFFVAVGEPGTLGPVQSSVVHLDSALLLAEGLQSLQIALTILVLSPAMTAFFHGFEDDDMPRLEDFQPNAIPSRAQQTHTIEQARAVFEDYQARGDPLRLVAVDRKNNIVLEGIGRELDRTNPLPAHDNTGQLAGGAWEDYLQRSQPRIASSPAQPSLRRRLSPPANDQALAQSINAIAVVHSNAPATSQLQPPRSSYTQAPQGLVNNVLRRQSQRESGPSLSTSARPAVSSTSPTSTSTPSSTGRNIPSGFSNNMPMTKEAEEYWKNRPGGKK
jgi:hypothetical protein